MAKRRNRTVMPSKTEGKTLQQNRKAGCTHPLRPNSEFRIPNSELSSSFPRAHQRLCRS